MDSHTKKKRNLVDTTLLNGTKVNEKSNKRSRDDCSQIYFPLNGKMSSSLRLFEVPSNFDISSANELRIIGDDTNHAVLCTDSNTFTIKKVETSNSVFLVAPSDDKRFSIESLHHDYYELVQTSPNIDVLRNILSATVYVSAAVDESNPYLEKNLLTLDDLHKVVQASRKELSAALTSLGAVDINGYIRIVDRDALRDVTKLVLDTILEHEWNIREISDESCVEELTGNDRGEDSCDARMIQFALEKLGGICRGNGLWELDERSVAREAAQATFRKHVKETNGNMRMSIDDFLEEWTMTTPGAMSCPPLEYLKGIVIKEAAADSKIPVASGHAVKYPCYLFLNLEDLPQSNEKLFEHLFSRRTKYTREEIEPYLENNYGSPGQPKDVDSLLLLHTEYVDGFYIKK